MASAARAPGAAVLPPLREEIGISRGPAALDGSPTWTLHDPAITGAIVGARNARQAEQVMRAGDLRLREDEVEEIETFFAQTAA